MQTDLAHRVIMQQLGVGRWYRLSETSVVLLTEAEARGCFRVTGLHHAAAAATVASLLITFTSVRCTSARFQYTPVEENDEYSSSRVFAA